MTDIQAKVGDQIEVNIVSVAPQFMPKADQTARRNVMVQETINGKRAFFDTASSPARAGDFVLVEVVRPSKKGTVYFVKVIRPIRVAEKN